MREQIDIRVADRQENVQVEDVRGPLCGLREMFIGICILAWALMLILLWMVGFA